MSNGDIGTSTSSILATIPEATRLNGLGTAMFVMTSLGAVADVSTSFWRTPSLAGLPMRPANGQPLHPTGRSDSNLAHVDGPVACSCQCCSFLTVAPSEDPGW